MTGRIRFASSRDSVAWDQVAAYMESVTQNSANHDLLAIEFGSDGSFRVEDVPPGAYRLKLWRPGNYDHIGGMAVRVPEIPVEGRCVHQVRISFRHYGI